MPSARNVFKGPNPSRNKNTISMEESCLLMRMLLSGLLANGGSQEQPGLPLAWLKMYEVQAH